MKLLISAFLVSFLFASCSNELSKKEALNLLQKEDPKIIFYRIYTADPGHAERLIQQGFVEKGLVKIDSNASILSQRIFFTDKTKDLLTPTPPEEKTALIQRVKTAEKYVKEISGIRMMGKEKAVVEFVTVYRNLTPFSTLSKKAIKEEQEAPAKAYFSKYTDGWRIDNRNSLDFLME